MGDADENGDPVKAYKAAIREVAELGNHSPHTCARAYLDPRITFAWVKRRNLPIEQFLSHAARRRWPWALDVSSAFKFIFILRSFDVCRSLFAMQPSIALGAALHSWRQQVHIHLAYYKYQNASPLLRMNKDGGMEASMPG